MLDAPPHLGWAGYAVCYHTPNPVAPHLLTCVGVQELRHQANQPPIAPDLCGDGPPVPVLPPPSPFPNRARKLDMSGQRFEGLGSPGAEALAAALKQNAALEELNLSSNHVGSVGAAGLASALRVNTCLQRLHLGMNQLDPASVKQLLAAAAPRKVAVST